MKLRDWDSSSCRTALTCALAALCINALAGTVSRPRIADFEYFPAYTGERPPPLDAIGPERTKGIVFVPGRKPPDARWLRGRFDLDEQPPEVQALYISAANCGVRAFVNGVEIGSTSLSDAERFSWN